MSKPVALAVVLFCMASSLGALALGAGAPEEGASGRAVIMIHDVYELQNISNDLEADYELANDIDASDTKNWDSGKGFQTMSTSFGGTLEGRGHAIDGLYINRPQTALVALIHHNTGEIRNLTLTNLDITGGDAAAGLVNNNSRTIDNCHISGKVNAVYQASGLAGVSATGTISNCSFSGQVISREGSAAGLVGYGAGDIFDCRVGGMVSGNHTTGGFCGSNWKGAIWNCSSTAKVDGGERTGGFIGYNTGTVSRCFSTGNVSGTDDVGGFAGFVDNQNGWLGDINDCYSTGLVMGTSRVGGLVGSIEVGGGTGGHVYRCYSAGWLVGGSDCGGLIGKNLNADVADCFWDNQTSGCTTSAGGTGKSTADMKSRATFTNWDFDAVWKMEEGVSYPYLRDMQTIPQNRAPTIITSPPTTATAGMPLSVQFAALDPDGDALTWLMTSNASWLSMTASGLLSGTPGESDTGRFVVAVSVSDGRGGTASITFELSVREAGHPPAWSNVPGDKICYIGRDFGWPILATDPDAGDAVTYAVASDPQSGVQIDASSGELGWLNTTEGKYTITVSATDGVFTIRHHFNLTVIWHTRILSPASGSEVAGTVEIVVLTPACNCINVTWIYIDGAFLGSGNPVQTPDNDYAAYSHTWDTVSAGNGWHTVMALSPHRDVSVNASYHVNNTGPAGKQPVIVQFSAPENKTVKASSVQTFSVEAVSPTNATLSYEWKENGVTISTNKSFSLKFAPGNHTLMLLIGDGHYTTMRAFNFTVAPPPKTIDTKPVSVPGFEAGVAAAALFAVVALGLFWRRDRR